jgi:light-regulated signal transduction histidine kinase (bacteriophytochrome)
MTAKLATSYGRLEGEIAERRQAQDLLQRAHVELEMRVEERTKDLAAANRSLVERTRQLEAANKELESFSYSVSHDLRAPLRAIDGFSKMLEKDLEGVLEGETRRKFETIQRNAQQMGQLIDDLLAFSRLGRAPLEMRPVDMGRLANGVVDDQKSINPGRELRITVDNVPASWGDSTLLRQVLVNLISNAIKFTKPRETAVIEVGGREDDGEYVYYVKDNGVGFDMAYVDKLFGVFQRLHSTREFEGTGVGLAIVQRIVHRHGGRVWAEGHIGEGATLYFSLPERRQHEEQPKQPD